MSRSSDELLENCDPEIERIFHLKKNLANLKKEMDDNIERLHEANAEINRLWTQLEANNVVRGNAQANQQNLQYNPQNIQLGAWNDLEDNTPIYEYYKPGKWVQQRSIALPVVSARNYELKMSLV